MDSLGRKSALLVSANIGWLLLITANLWNSPAGFITVLLTGQFFTGCGLGLGMLPVSEIKLLLKLNTVKSVVLGRMGKTLGQNPMPL